MQLYTPWHIIGPTSRINCCGGNVSFKHTPRDTLYVVLSLVLLHTTHTTLKWPQKNTVESWLLRKFRNLRLCPLVSSFTVLWLNFYHTLANLAMFVHTQSLRWWTYYVLSPATTAERQTLSRSLTGVTLVLLRPIYV